MAIHNLLYLSIFLFSSLSLLTFSGKVAAGESFSIKEATIHDIQIAFYEGKLTSRQLVEFYLKEIKKLNPIIHGVMEVNPDALYEADKADRERKEMMSHDMPSGPLHGIPILIKENIAIKGKLNTTVGSFALLGSIVPRDATTVWKLKKAGAIILGTATLTEWNAARSVRIPAGWSARGGQGKNPYVLSGTPCGTSSGSAISVAANLVTVSLATETDGSIICPAGLNSVVGFKPTVGLTSRAGIVPITPRQDSVGPISRTVSDAVYVLDAIVGFDPRDAEATREASKFIPVGGYKQFLKADGLKGKRLGIVRNPFYTNLNGSILKQIYENHFNLLRQKGAILVDNLEITNLSIIVNATRSGEGSLVAAEMKVALNAYLKSLVTSPVRSLADIIAFIQKFSVQEKLNEYGQDAFLNAEKTNGIGEKEKEAMANLKRLSKGGLEKLMKKNKLDALVVPGFTAFQLIAIGRYPGISVPAGYQTNGMPVGITFWGLRGSEPKLIEVAYGFEQATKIRKPPSFLP